MEPEFEHEYNLKYLGRIGNLLTPALIDIAVSNGETLKDIPANLSCLHSIGLDPGYGSSKTAIVLTEHLKEEDKIRVLYAEEFDHPNPTDIVNIIFILHTKYQNCWVFVDGSARSQIIMLKITFGENPNYERPEDVSQS